jgi:LysM repeat protein
MDTISRENNSMLPVGGIIVGVIGLLLGGYSAISLSKVNKLLADHQVKIDKVDGIEGQAQAAGATADKAKADIAALQRSTQTAFDTVGPELARLSGEILKIQEAAKKPVVTGKKGGSGEPAVAGPGEYVVKAGDTGAKIARANGCSIGDLQTVNPGVNFSKLHPGDKLKLPKK